MRALLLVIPLIVSGLAACSSVPNSAVALPKPYVWLGLFRNENTFPVEITLYQDRGVYTEMTVPPQSINRTAILPRTIAAVARSGRQHFTSALVTATAQRDYDHAKRTVYYRITQRSIIPVAPEEGRAWDR